MHDYDRTAENKHLHVNKNNKNDETQRKHEENTEYTGNA